MTKLTLAEIFILLKKSSIVLPKRILKVSSSFCLLNWSRSFTPKQSQTGVSELFLIKAPISMLLDKLSGPVEENLLV